MFLIKPMISGGRKCGYVVVNVLTSCYIITYTGDEEMSAKKKNDNENEIENWESGLQNREREIHGLNISGR
jgi:hypothetical protein